MSTRFNVFVAFVLYKANIMNANIMFRVEGCYKKFVGSGHFSAYPYPTKCSFSFNTYSNNEYMRLRWSSFEVEGKMPSCADKGYVDVYLGCGRKKRKLTTFCSSNMKGLPHDIYSYSGCVQLNIKKTEDSKIYFHYESISKNSSVFRYKCSSFLGGKNLYVSNSGVVASPMWPNIYLPRYLPFYGFCDWDIELSDEKRIILNVMDVDMYTENDGDCYYTDYLRIRGTKSSSDGASFEKKYCQAEPFSLDLNFHEVEVHFSASRYRKKYHNRGFIVGWVAFGEKKLSGGAIAGIVIAVLVVLSCCGCCYCYKRKKRKPPQSSYLGNNVLNMDTHPSQSMHETNTQTHNTSTNPSTSLISQQINTASNTGFPPPSQNTGFPQEYPQQTSTNQDYPIKPGYAAPPPQTNYPSSYPTTHASFPAHYPSSRSQTNNDYPDMEPPPYPGLPDESPLITPLDTTQPSAPPDTAPPAYPATEFAMS